jgi:hypothetical protein
MEIVFPPISVSTLLNMFSPDVQHQGKAQRQIIRLDYPPAPYALFSRTSLNNKNLKQFLNASTV